MDDWGFGIWAVPVALSAALCFAAAERLESSHSTATRALHHFLLVGSWIGLGATAILVAMHLLGML
jgi:hypothetical protein